MRKNNFHGRTKQYFVLVLLLLVTFGCAKQITSEAFMNEYLAAVEKATDQDSIVQDLKGYYVDDDALTKAITNRSYDMRSMACSLDENREEIQLTEIKETDDNIVELYFTCSDASVHKIRVELLPSKNSYQIGKIYWKN